MKVGASFGVLLLLPISLAVEANCGPFNMFQDSDYCIICPNSAPFKENSCPGGDVGLVAEGVSHPGCQIAYWSAQTCNPRAAAAVKADVMAAAKRPQAAAEPGKATASAKGDEVTIKMKKADFEKLMTLK